MAMRDLFRGRERDPQRRQWSDEQRHGRQEDYAEPERDYGAEGRRSYFGDYEGGRGYWNDERDHGRPRTYVGGLLPGESGWRHRPYGERYGGQYASEYERRQSYQWIVARALCAASASVGWM